EEPFEAVERGNSDGGLQVGPVVFVALLDRQARSEGIGAVPRPRVRVEAVQAEELESQRQSLLRSRDGAAFGRRKVLVRIKAEAGEIARVPVGTDMPAGSNGAD